MVLQFLIACSIIVNRAFGGEKSLVFRVLLVEFAATAGFHRAEWFPFIKGRLKKSHEVQWVRFGVDPANMLQFESVGVSLNQEDTAVLRWLLDSWNPIYILFGLTPSTNLLKDLSLPAPDCQILHAGPADSRNSKPIASLWEDGPAFPDSDDNVRLLTNLAGQIPDYGWIPGNTAASTTNPLPFLIAEIPACTTGPFLRTLSWQAAPRRLDSTRRLRLLCTARRVINRSGRRWIQSSGTRPARGNSPNMSVN